jgi:KDO2-lipid IV(A) lauroyltransferase
MSSVDFAPSPARAPAIPVRHRVEYLALRAALGLFGAVPAGCVLPLASGIARVLYPLAGARRREAERRVREVLGASASAGEARRVAWTSFRNVCLNAGELALARRPAWRAAARSRMDVDDAIRTVQAARAEGRGVIVALAHAGNWDLAGIVAAQEGIPGVYIARGQKNPLTNRLLVEFRQLAGGLVVERDDPRLVRHIVKALRENRMLAILVDLRARHGGVERTFLGRPAWLYGGVSTLARLSGAPVVPAFFERLPGGRHAWHVAPPVRSDPDAPRDADEARVMQYVLDFLSDRIRRQPDQYFWYNRRWVLQPHR